MTIALFPRRANAIGRFARFSLRHPRNCAQRATPDGIGAAVNAGRWATLPGEYSGPSARPLDRALPAITAAGDQRTGRVCGLRPRDIVHLAGMWVGRVAFEGSADGVRWSPIALVSFDGGSESATTDRPGLWRTVPTQSVAFIRLRVTHLSAGTVLVCRCRRPDPASCGARCARFCGISDAINQGIQRPARRYAPVFCVGICPGANVYTLTYRTFVVYLTASHHIYSRMYVVIRDMNRDTDENTTRDSCSLPTLMSRPARFGDAHLLKRLLSSSVRSMNTKR